MSEKQSSRFYVHELGKKIADSRHELGWLSSVSGVPRPTLYDLVNGKTRHGRVAAALEAKLAEALGGDASWPEWRDRGQGISKRTPNDRRRDTAEAFLAAVTRNSSTVNTPTPPATATPDVSVGSPNLIVMSEEALLRLFPELADVAFRRDNLAPQEEGTEIAIECHVNLRLVAVGADLDLGIVRARLICERVGAGSGRFVASTAQEALPGATLEIHGTPNSMVAEFKASGRPALLLNGLREEPISLGTYRDSKAGAAFAIRLLANSQFDFVHVRRTPVNEARGESITRKKVLTHFAKWQKQIPREIDIELFSQTWRIAGYRDL